MMHFQVNRLEFILNVDPYTYLHKHNYTCNIYDIPIAITTKFV